MIEIDEDNLKHGVLGLVMAIVEVVRDALNLQAIKRMDSGVYWTKKRLNGWEEPFKEKQGIAETVRAALASFETSARYALEFPSGTSYETAAGKESTVNKENCPQCDKRVLVEDLISTGCSWCGWISANARALKAEA